MKREFHRCWNKIAGGLLILLMASLLFNQALYTHTHILPDGSIVSHAHPFNKKEESKQGAAHQHSTLEFYLIQHLLLLFLVSITVPRLISRLTEYLKTRPASSAYMPAFPLTLPGRAPPIGM